MSISRAAVAALGLCACLMSSGGAGSFARAAEPLTLDAALMRIVQHHPALRALDFTRDSLRAAADEAALAPPLTLSADVENVAGTGARSGVGGAEWTLGLAGVLERGGKRAVRELVAARRIDAQSPRRAATALDLLADGASRYLDVVEAQQDAALLSEEVQVRERWAGLARERFAAGAIPGAMPLLAEAKAERARFEQARARQRIVTASRRLAVAWGDDESAADVIVVAAMDPRALPAPPSSAALVDLVKRNPGLAMLSAEERLCEAQVRLAEAARSADLAWHAGLRRLEDAHDWGLVAGVSLSLDAGARAEPAVRTAQAERESARFDREASERRLVGLLLDARALYVESRDEAALLRDGLLARLDEATAAAERAWRNGALSPVEWSALQDERLAARRRELGAAIAAQRALIEMQRLTAEPLDRLPQGEVP